MHYKNSHFYYYLTISLAYFSLEILYNRVIYIMRRDIKIQYFSYTYFYYINRPNYLYCLLFSTYIPCYNLYLVIYINIKLPNILRRS